MKFWRWLLHNFAIKIISLILAVTTWFYVFNKIERDGVKNVPSSKQFPDYGKIISKKLYVNAIFVGEPPPEYEFFVETVQIEPQFFIVAGPASVLEELDKLTTEPIDLSRFKKTTHYEATVASIAPGIDTESLTVKVAIPISKREIPKEPVDD